MVKIAYLWDRYSRIFMGSTYTQPSPIESGQDILPAFSTLEEPPTWEEGQAVYRNLEDTAWEIKSAPEPVVYEPSIAEQLVAIDTETSNNITSGFDYKFENYDSYHFSYDSIDQQNFTDAVNVVTLVKLGLPGLPETIDWNAWTIVKDEDDNEISRTMTRITLTPDMVLELYSAAIMHKTTQLEIGSRRKQALFNPTEEI